MERMSAATPPSSAPANDTVLCPRCSAPFECGAKAGGCWCTGVVLDDQIRADLATFYKGCLCRECLETIEGGRPPRPSVWVFLKKNLKRSA
jgi:hypothetical protein